jgi:hypothetical protein
LQAVEQARKEQIELLEVVQEENHSLKERIQEMAERELKFNLTTTKLKAEHQVQI